MVSLHYNLLLSVKVQTGLQRVILVFWLCINSQLLTIPVSPKILMSYFRLGMKLDQDKLHWQAAKHCIIQMILNIFFLYIIKHQKGLGSYVKLINFQNIGLFYADLMEHKINMYVFACCCFSWILVNTNAFEIQVMITEQRYRMQNKDIECSLQIYRFKI